MKAKIIILIYAMFVCFLSACVENDGFNDETKLNIVGEWVTYNDNDTTFLSFEEEEFFTILRSNSDEAFGDYTVTEDNVVFVNYYTSLDGFEEVLSGKIEYKGGESENTIYLYNVPFFENKTIKLIRK